MACGSRALPPTPPTGRSPSLSSVTACGPGPKTGSGQPARPACNLPPHDTPQNKIWLEIVQIALGLPAWVPMPASGNPVSAAAQLVTTAQPVTTGRRCLLRLARHWPWTGEATTALERLALLPNPG